MCQSQISNLAISNLKNMKEVKSVDYGLEKIFAGAQDFLPLLGTRSEEHTSELQSR
jgi:hypothetical protein